RRLTAKVKTFSYPLPTYNVVSQTLTRACPNYPSTPLGCPGRMLYMKNCGKNVRIFGFKVAVCEFQLKIFDLKTKTGISTIPCRISKIQPCQSEVQRCQFERGGGTVEVPRGLFVIPKGVSERDYG